MTSRFARNRKRSVSSVVGGVLLFAMIFSVGFTFIYMIGQDNLFYQQAAKSNNAQLSQQGSEHLIVDGFVSNNNLGFYVNNTGIASQIISFWIFNGTSGALLQYKNTTTLPKVLPYYLSQGTCPAACWTYTNTTYVVTSSSQRFIIKVLTARGTTAVGTYPSDVITSSAVNALVAGGFGSLQMTFSSFTWYDYKSGPVAQTSQSISWQNGCNYGGGCTTYFNNLCANGAQCNGGSWVVDLANPHPGSLSPEGYLSSCTTGGGGYWWQQYENCYYNEIPMVLSVNITNDDPGLANIVLNSESNLWITETCDFGSTEGNCPNGNPVFVFYALNVNPSTGAIQSLNQGSFSQIVIPYGTSKTLYYGSEFDMSLNSYNYVALSSYNSAGQQQSYYGQFAVFLLFAGTKISQTSIESYGQNIPFESTTAGDNLGWYSETPTTCTAGTQSTFQLTVTNSPFSNSSAAINNIVLNASALTSVTYSTLPSGWTASVSNGFITWSTSSSAINPNNQLTFTWKGTPPSSAKGQQLILPLTIKWNGGTFNTLSAAEVCND